MFFRNAVRNPDRSKGRYPLILCLILLAALIAASVGTYFRYHRHPPPPPEKIVLGIVTTDNAVLVHIASELGLFSKYGIDVSIKEYEVGSSVMDDLEAGLLDIAATSEFALVREGFNRNDLQAISSIALSNNIQFIARRDRVIESPADLKGKRIGVLRGTTCEFFLATFLAFSGILNSEVQVVNIRPSDAASGILSKNIDAAMLWEPYAYRLKTALGKNAIIWEGQGGQDYYVLLISTRSFTGVHAAAVEKLLRALVDAERFTETNPAESKGIIQRHFRYSDAYMAWTWAQSSPKVCLTQDLLIHMEDEGRWLKKREWITYPGIPNYYALMCLDGLEKVNPDAVSIIH
jgi:NitT/TauT family transport system substrate-binding protein